MFFSWINVNSAASVTVCVGMSISKHHIDSCTVRTPRQERRRNNTRFTRMKWSVRTYYYMKYANELSKLIIISVKLSITWSSPTEFDNTRLDSLYFVNIMECRLRHCWVDVMRRFHINMFRANPISSCNIAYYISSIIYLQANRCTSVDAIISSVDIDNLFLRFFKILTKKLFFRFKINRKIQNVLRRLLPAINPNPNWCSKWSRLPPQTPRYLTIKDIGKVSLQ